MLPAVSDGIRIPVHGGSEEVAMSAHGSDRDDRDVSEVDRSGLMATAQELYELVEDLRGGDRPSAIDALFHLSNIVCHQRMAVGARTPLVLPTLIALLSCHEQPARVEIFELVQAISRASTAWRRAAHDAGVAYEEAYRPAVRWEMEVDRIFMESVPRLEALSRDPNPVIGRMADELAARYPSPGPHR
jgi:hypothetical protein